MRLWSISLKYLDAIGLVALWREALLAKAVIYGKTKGYRNHPQLIRFKNAKNPKEAINTYLYYIADEASRRGYAFDKRKIESKLVNKKLRLKVAQGQLDYELSLLRAKLKKRSRKDFLRLLHIKKAEPGRLFIAVKGVTKPELWEKVKDKLY